MLLKAFFHPGNKAQAARQYQQKQMGSQCFNLIAQRCSNFITEPSTVQMMVFIMEIQERMGSGTERACRELQLLRLPGCVTLHKLPNFSVPKFSPLKEEGNKYIMVPTLHRAAITNTNFYSRPVQGK